MKIITWNVNGLRACIEKGLMKYLQSSNADIIALQETKVGVLRTPLPLSDYYFEWNNSKRLGYSGTVCLFKKRPLTVKYGFENSSFDKEGRLITLEYPNFYFINIYVPKSQSGLDRWSYRLEWDTVFAKYLPDIIRRKPVIVCGDFNVARSHIDIYPENLRNIENPSGFLTDEREGFNTLLEIGFSDVFRELHPTQEHAYTWWSNRQHKRKENRGWRLDYFLVSNNIFPLVKHCEIRSDIYGSDHAPVEMVIDIKEMDIESLERSWRLIDWKAARETLLKLQKNIALAAIKKDRDEITKTQKRLVHSIEAKVLAVRHVCDGNNLPGIDGVKWESDADKMRAALSLDSRGYKASPSRLLVVSTKGQTKERHVQIPTYFDRGMQVLYAYSLDPVSESTGDKQSFAFRRGRSTHDIHACLIKAFGVKQSPQYVLKADVKACYASICHAWLLENIPMPTRALREFLKAGHVFGGELFPADNFGISLGSSLSPILGNMVLDGMQKAIYDALHGCNPYADNTDGYLLRFADDIIITAQTMESAVKIKKILHSFLAVRGLALSEKKTHIIDLANGFDFLSRNYRYVGGVICTTPSESAVAKMEQKLRDLITKYRGGQKALIDKINKILTGWATYHKITDAEQTFRRIDYLVTILLLELCEKLNPHMSRVKIISKYFYQEPDGEYVYALENKPAVRVCRLVDTILVIHHPVVTQKNPYIDTGYYEKLTDSRAIMSVTGKYKSIWTRQRGKCYYCGKSILKDQQKIVIAIDQAKPRHPKNLAYIHEYCSSGQAEFYESEFEVHTQFDFHKILLHMSEKTTSASSKKSKFIALTEYFRQRKEPVFTLTFKEIEKIIEQPLCRSALKYKKYWYKRGESYIDFCWRSNGYAIRSLNLEQSRVVFERVEDMGSVVAIPPVILSGRIPHDAKVEIESMFEYIRKKYGL